MTHRDDEDDFDAEPWGDVDEDETDECPHCSASIYDDSVRCPRCGNYLGREDAPTRKPWWVVAGVLACLGMVAFWIFNP